MNMKHFLAIVMGLSFALSHAHLPESIVKGAFLGASTAVGATCVAISGDSVKEAWYEYQQAHKKASPFKLTNKPSKDEQRSRTALAKLVAVAAVSGACAGAVVVSTIALLKTAAHSVRP